MLGAGKIGALKMTWTFLDFTAAVSVSTGVVKLFSAVPEGTVKNYLCYQDLTSPYLLYMRTKAGELLCSCYPEVCLNRCRLKRTLLYFLQTPRKIVPLNESTITA